MDIPLRPGVFVQAREECNPETGVKREPGVYTTHTFKLITWRWRWWCVAVTLPGYCPICGHRTPAEDEDGEAAHNRHCPAA